MLISTIDSNANGYTKEGVLIVQVVELWMLQEMK
jgi:hypothetical protein